MTKLSQVAIAVKNIDSAKTVFETLTKVSSGEKHFVENQKVNIAMIELGETVIEILEPNGDDTPISNFLERRGGGIHHIGIKTKQFEKTIEDMRKIGVRTLGEPSIGAEGHRVIFFHPKDTFGVLIELEEEQ